MKHFTVGIIVARMQVPYLTTAHKALIETVLTEHESVVLFLGVSPTISKSNPLSFRMRYDMIREEYPKQCREGDLDILPLKDIPGDNSSWVNNLDAKILNAMNVKNKIGATLYGSRDSFIDIYQSNDGNYKTIYLPEIPNVSGTQIREACTEPTYTRSMAEGIIWAINQIK